MKIALAIITTLAIGTSAYLYQQQQSSQEQALALELKLKQQQLLIQQLQTKLFDQSSANSQALEQLKEAYQVSQKKMLQEQEDIAIQLEQKTTEHAQLVQEHQPAEAYPSSQLSPYEHETRIKDSIYLFNAEHNNTSIDEIKCDFENCDIKLSINAAEKSNPQLSALLKHLNSSKKGDYKVGLVNLKSISMTKKGLKAEFKVAI